MKPERLTLSFLMLYMQVRYSLGHILFITSIHNILMDANGNQLCSLVWFKIVSGSKLAIVKHNFCQYIEGYNTYVIALVFLQTIVYYLIPDIYFLFMIDR